MRYKRGGGSSYQGKSTPCASVLGLDGGAVPSLGGGAMDLASVLGGGGLQAQMYPLAGALGGPLAGPPWCRWRAELACWPVCTSRQPTKPQCNSVKFASCRATEGRGGPEAGDGKASGCAGAD